MRHLILGLLLIGCTGSFAPFSGGGTPPTGSGGGGGPGPGPGPGEPRPIGPDGDPIFGRELPAANTRVARLSHGEFENTVQDLMKSSTPLGVTKAYVNDPTSTLFTNNGGELTVLGNQWLDYQKTAEELAQKATATADALTQFCGGVKPTNAKEMVSSAGLRAFRRPLAADEAAAFEALFAKGTQFYPKDDALLAGSRVVIEALLQSPHFLYRIEGSNEVNNGVIQLSPYELAARLSYGLWQTMPDNTLLEAASSQSILTEAGFSSAVDRMLESERARSTLKRFHAQLLSASKFLDITRSTTLFPEFKPELRNSMYEEQQRFTDAIVFDANGKVNDFYTAPYSFVDANLAAVYGLKGNFGSAIEKYTFQGEPRQGLLSQIGFLASNATSTESDPIHRGVFVNHRLLCSDLPAPPKNVPPLPAPDPNAPPQTLRERITAFTGTGTCGAGCHSTLINPVGFAFEKYDALGRLRTNEKNGRMIDARDSFAFGDTAPLKTFDGALELSNLIATEVPAHTCYADHLVQFLHGRAHADVDKEVAGRVGYASKNGKLTIKQMIAEVLKSEGFKTRAVNP